MRQLLTLSAFALLAVLSACGGGGSDPWSVLTSAQSAALTTPGTGTVTNDGHTITLTGGNGASTGCSSAQYGFTSSPCTVVASPANGKGTFSFDWSYTTTDSSGPGADLFGMIVDGQVVPISDPGGAMTQSGHREVTATSSLSFFLNCTDCTDGRADAVVTSFQAK
jgi:hypothetical protein